jgi:membrane protein
LPPGATTHVDFLDTVKISPALLWSMAKESVIAWMDDFAPSMGAAIAYYTTFSIAPTLVIVIAVLGLFFDSDVASNHIYAQIVDMVGTRGADAVRSMVTAASAGGGSWWATLIGVVLLLIGATTVFAELQTSLDRIWRAPAAKGSGGLWGILRGRLLSLGLVVSIGFVLLVSLVISAGLSAMGGMWSGSVHQLGWLLSILNVVVSLIVTTIMFALMFKILPRVQIAWTDVGVGAAVTAVLFTIGKALVGLYIGKSDVVSGFGAAGSVIVLLVWVYYSAQIFLLGAEFTWIFAHRLGSRRQCERSPKGDIRGGEDSTSQDVEKHRPGEAAASPEALD